MKTSWPHFPFRAHYTNVVYLEKNWRKHWKYQLWGSNPQRDTPFSLYTSAVSLSRIIIINLRCTSWKSKLRWYQNVNFSIFDNLSFLKKGPSSLKSELHKALFVWKSIFPPFQLEEFSHDAHHIDWMILSI